MLADEGINIPRKIISNIKMILTTGTFDNEINGVTGSRIVYYTNTADFCVVELNM